MYGGRTEFRPARWLYIFFSIVLVASLFITFYSYRNDGITWVTLGCAIVTVLGIGGIADLFVTSVSLQEKNIVVKRLLRETRIERGAIENVSWEKGSGVSLRLKDGSWAKLPEAIDQGQGFTNSLRAWLKAA